MRTRIFTALSLAGIFAAGTVFAAEMSAPSSTTGKPSTPAAVTAPADAADMTGAAKGEMTNTVTGTVKSVDAKTHTFTLDDGSKFKLDDKMKGDDLKAGQKVTLTFTTEGTNKVVTHYEIES